jgi:hypothetical protein
MANSVLSNRLLSNNLPMFLFEDPAFSLDQSSTDRKLEFLSIVQDNPRNTIKEFEDIDENAPTIRSETSIMCINCYESIPVNEINTHSLYCVSPDNDKGKIKEKLSKLLLHIREQKLDSTDRTDLAFIELEEVCKSLLEEALVVPSETAAGLFERINQISKDFYPFPYILVLAQRLSKLAEGLTDDRVVLSSWLLRENHTINQIESTLHLSICEKDSFLSNCSHISAEPSHTRSFFQSESTPKNHEKYFYSQCIKKKMQIPPNHSGKNLSIFNLYQECQEKSIPVQEWPAFISTALEGQISVIS